MPFAPPNLKSYVCAHVFAEKRPILLVAHEDGDWSFMCGRCDHGGSDDYRVVGVSHVVERDPSVNDCSDLPNGYEAEREGVGKPWLRTQIDAAAS